MADQYGNRAGGARGVRGAGGAGGASGAGGAGGASGARGACGAVSEPRITDESDLVTDAFLSRVADNLGNVFFRLGLLLGVARPCIERLETNYVRDTWRITYEVLVKWRETSVNRSNAVAMMEDLIGAMTELKLNDVAENVRHELVRLLKDKIERQESRWQARLKDCEDQLRQSEMKTKTASENVRQLNEQVRLLKDEALKTKEQVKLLKEELRGAKAEVESCRQKYDVPATSPAVFPSASSEKERKERLRQLTKIATSGKPANERAIDVMRLLREYEEPQLWHELSHHIVTDGLLNISEVITADNLPDLEFLLSSGEARDVTSLVLRNNKDVFRREEDVERLCRGLAGLRQLKELDLVQTGLTDDGLTRVCRTVRKHCRQLIWLGCFNNPGLTDGVEDSVRQTLRGLSRLTIRLGGCRLSTDVRRRLEAEFHGRFNPIFFQLRRRQRLTSTPPK